MKTDVLNNLRQLRGKSNPFPIRGEQLKAIPFTDAKKFQATLILSASAGMITTYFLHMKSFRLPLSLHLGIQVFLVMFFSFMMAWPVFSQKTRAKVKSDINQPKAGVLSWLSFSVVMSYGIILLSTFVSGYVELHHTYHLSDIFFLSIWMALKNLHFYKMWLGCSLLLGLCFTALHFYQVSAHKYNIKKYLTKTFQLWIGESTGSLSKLSHGAGLTAKQNIALSLADAAQNIVIFGAIGSGKTTRAIHPLLLQLLDQECGGLIFDIKGDFQYAVTHFAQTTQSHKRINIIGEQGASLNLIQGLTPEMAASFLKSAMMLNGSSRMDSFWIDTATELCRNTLGILHFLPKNYNLASLYDYLFSREQQDQINTEIDQLLPILDDHQSRLLNAYTAYQERVFANFDEKVQAGVLASVSQILSPFQHPTLIDLFCKDSSLNMDSVIDGKIFFVNLPLSRWGLGGKVAYNFIKLRFFNIMQQRATQSQWNQTQPVFFMCDEYQEIVSGNKDGLSDLNFWDKSRSSKTIGIISTQSVSSFYAAMGDRDMANAILQNFRQKICFRTEDQATLDLLNRLTGHVEVANRTLSKQRGSSGTGMLNSHNNQSKTETINYVNRSVLDPQLVRNLHPNQAIALLSFNGQSCDDVFNMLPVFV